MNEKTLQPEEKNPKNEPQKTSGIARYCCLIWLWLLTLSIALCVFMMARFIVGDLMNVILLKNNGVSTNAKVISSMKSSYRYKYSSETSYIHEISYNSNLFNRVHLDRSYPVNSYVNIIYNKNNLLQVGQGDTNMSIGKLYLLNSEAHGNIFSLLYLDGGFIFLVYILYLFLKLLYVNCFT